MTDEERDKPAPWKPVEYYTSDFSPSPVERLGKWAEVIPWLLLGIFVVSIALAWAYGSGVL